MNEVFVEHTVHSAPEAARKTMLATTDRLGYLPAAVAAMATAPLTLNGFLQLSAMFERTSLTAVQCEVVILTVATRNACQVCVAMHTAKLTAMRADPGLIEALRAQRTLDDPALEALRLFTVDLLDTAGAVDAERTGRFLAAGFTAEQALEVVLGIGAYTLSTMANRLTGAGLDAALEPFAWR